jgi:hemoglobin
MESVMNGLMKHALMALVLVPMIQPVLAQEAKDPNYRGGFHYSGNNVAPPKDDSLFKALGGEEKIAAFTKDFVSIIKEDPKIGKFFEGVNLERLAQQLTRQFIDLSGGPAKYAGRDMAEAHAQMGVSNGDFNKLAEDLELAMDRAAIDYATQTRLIAILAPMQKSVVTN